METQATSTRADARHTATNGIDHRSDEAHLREQLRALVRQRPWTGVAAAGVVGAVLGGLVLSRAARLLFFAAVGYAARGLWQGEGRLDLDDLAARFASRSKHGRDKGGRIE